MTQENNQAQEIAQLVNAPPFYSDGCLVERISDTTLEIKEGQLRDSTNEIDIFVRSPITVDLEVQGINGRNNSTLATGWYAIYVMASRIDPTLPQSVALFANEVEFPVPLTISFQSRSLDISRLVGWVFVDTSVIRPFLMTLGGTNHRKIHYTSAIPALSAVNNTAIVFQDPVLVSTTIPRGATLCGGVLEGELMVVGDVDVFLEQNPPTGRGIVRVLTTVAATVPNFFPMTFDEIPVLRGAAGFPGFFVRTNDASNSIEIFVTSFSFNI